MISLKNSSKPVRLLTLLFIIVPLFITTSVFNPSPAPGMLESFDHRTLSSEERAVIQETILSNQYKFATNGLTASALNPSQNLTLDYSKSGMTLSSSTPTETWDLTLRLSGYGYQSSNFTQVFQPTEVTGEDERAYIEWDADITEWWINKSDGVEQGFTLERRPTVLNTNDKLIVEMILSGSLIPQMIEGGVQFIGSDNEAKLTYDHLFVTDSTGQPFPAEMSLIGNRLRIEVADAGAVYPLIIDPFIQTNKLFAPVSGKGFGQSVDLSGDTLVVGSPYSGTGAAYVFERNSDNNNWTVVKTLLPSDGASADLFGWSVGIDGNTIVVGARFADINSYNNVGAAYVFERNYGGLNNWGQVKKIRPQTLGNSDYFGDSVDISGDTIVVGSPGDQDSTMTASTVGSAHVYERNYLGAENWGLVSMLTPPELEGFDEFGDSIAIDGDSIAIGVPGDDDTISDGGAVYIYNRDSSDYKVWNKSFKITTTDADQSADFGSSIDISGDLVIVGSPNNKGRAGRAYIFYRNTETQAWGSQKILNPTENFSGSEFGYSVSIDGDTAVVGADLFSSTLGAAGGAFVFSRDQGGTGLWGQTQTLVPSIPYLSFQWPFFGMSVAVDGKTITVGSPGDYTKGAEAGAAYVYQYGDSDISISASNDTEDTLLLGESFSWSFAISNLAAVDEAVFPPGSVIFSSELPDSALYKTPTASAIIGVTNSVNIKCFIEQASNHKELYCVALSGYVTISPAGSFNVEFLVQPQNSEDYALTNCEADPEKLIVDVDRDNNTCSDTVSVSEVTYDTDLEVGISNDTASVSVVEDLFNWTLNITNTGTDDSATFPDGSTILLDEMPTGANYSAPAALNFSGVTGSANISCVRSISSEAKTTMRCIADGGDVVISPGGSFDIKIPVRPTQTGVLANPEDLCAVDPDNIIPEINDSNNTCADTVTVSPISSQNDLGASLSNDTSDYGVVGTSFNWTAHIRNTTSTDSAYFDPETVIFEDELPEGATYGAPTTLNFYNITGSSNISCVRQLSTEGKTTVSCMAKGGVVAIGPGGEFDIQFSVTPTSVGSLVNPDGLCEVDPGDFVLEADDSNNTCSDTVTVTAVAYDTDLESSLSNDTSDVVVVGNAFEWTLSVSNSGTKDAATFFDGSTILVDELPANAAYGVPAATNFSNITGIFNVDCFIAETTPGKAVRCLANGDVTIEPGGSFDVSVEVTPTITGDLVNPDGACEVDPKDLFNEVDEDNNACSDTVTVIDPEFEAPVVNFGGATYPSQNAVLPKGITHLLVEFDMDVKGIADSNSANNIKNFLLFAAGANKVFDTKTCALGVSPLDLNVPIFLSSYDDHDEEGPFIATLTINNDVPIPAGSYRLLVCGSTSITNNDGVKLNDGVDSVLDFKVSSNASGGVNDSASAATNLPQTGYAQGIALTLPSQPVTSSYQDMAITLSIPKLGIKSAVVGVPETVSGWDVTWLGNEVGYLAGTAYPTWKGNTVLTGHVWDALNQPGIFSRLKDLKYGDEINVLMGDETYIYSVRESKSIPSDDVESALRHEDYDWVTLLTCEDYSILSGDYENRRIVRAILTRVE